jgi:transglutaminase-like putative cysteine protease
MITECTEEFLDCGADGICPDDPEYDEKDTGEMDGSYNRRNEEFIDCGCDQRCAEDPDYPGPDEGEEDQVYGSQYLVSTPTLPVQHLDIQKKAREVVGDAADRTEATQRLVDFVFDYVAKEPTVGVPNGLEVLYSRRGDCNEHTALFSSLARAAGIPTRIAAGVVYSTSIGAKGAFYYHAWPEVRLGGPTDWVPVDPTFGQFPADATHLKLVEGDLDRQVEILGVIGRLKLAVVGTR